MAATSLALAALLAALPGSAGSDDAGASLLQLVPEDAFALATLNDIASLKKAVAESAWTKFVQDEDVRPFVDHVLEQLTAEADLQQALGLIEDELDMSLSEAVDAVSGSVAAFVGCEGTDFEEDGFLGAVFLLGEERAAFHDLYDRLLARFEDEGSSSTTEYAGVAITEFALGAEGSLSTCEADDLVVLVAGPRPEAVLEHVQAAIDKHAGEDASPGLTESATLAAARAAAGITGHFELFLDLDWVWEMVEDEGGFEEDELPEELADGLRALHWAHMGARIGKGEELDWRITVSWPSEGLFGRIGDLLGPLPKEMVALMPRESIGVNTGNVDLHGAFELVMDLMADASPREHEEAVAGLAELKESMGLDVEHDLLAQLTGAMGQFRMEVPEAETRTGLNMMMGGAANPDLPSIGTGFVLGVREAGRVEAFVEALLELDEIGQTRTTEEFQGFNVHALDLSGLFQLHWAFAPDALAISMQPTAIRTVLRLTGKTDAPSALQHEKFRVTLEANRGASFFNVTDTAESMRIALESLQGVFGALPMIAMMSGEPDLADVPFGKDTPWPKAGAVDRYFEGVAYSAIERKGDSLRVRLATQ